MNEIMILVTSNVWLFCWMINNMQDGNFMIISRMMITKRTMTRMIAFCGEQFNHSFLPYQLHRSFDGRDFKTPGGQRRRERQRTIALINKNKSCTLECSVLTACSPSSSLILRGKLTIGVLWKTWTSNNKIWQSLITFEAEPFTKPFTENLVQSRKGKFIDDLKRKN